MTKFISSRTNFYSFFQ